VAGVYGKGRLSFETPRIKIKLITREILVKIDVGWSQISLRIFTVQSLV
jgi:hypothetical protein